MLLCSGILRRELFSVADPPGPPLFLDQTEAQRVDEYFLDTTTPPPQLISRSGSGTDLKKGLKS